MKEIKAALMYDFDKTLSPRDMQEFSFIPSVGFKEPQAFWEEVNRFKNKNKMDPILAYMYMMLKRAEMADQPIRREDFVRLGKEVELYPGVESWFGRINEYGRKLGVEVEHYVISSGLAEIIEGTRIAREFKKIYACKFCYNASGVAVWPATVVNYTTKTQYLFRINKGVLDENNDADLNRSTPEEMKRIPFNRMVYIADGFTDVPCMKLVKQNGGKAIAVYNQSGDASVAKSLVSDQRVDFIACSNYEENSEIDQIIKRILEHIAADARMDALSCDMKR